MVTLINFPKLLTDKLSKKAIGLSSIALVSAWNIAPCLASEQTSSRFQNQPSSSQTEDLKLAGFGGVLRNVDRTLDIVEQEKRREEQREIRERKEAERRAREEAKLRRQEEIDRARAAQEEQKRIDAARRQAYLDSLSPEEYRAFLLESQELQNAKIRAAADLVQGVANGVQAGVELGKWLFPPENSTR
jgi:membrane protein involved in colicin uptake